MNTDFEPQNATLHSTSAEVAYNFVDVLAKVDIVDWRDVMRVWFNYAGYLG
jgi:hypothetical protein